jgi:N6-L-threonylcarbamoyladenine synthase
LDAIAVTVGPGLVGSLLVGKMTAETLGWIWELPVYGINHIEGHLLSPLLSDPTLKPPFLGLVVSGGHTELIHVPKWGDYRLLGATHDDAAGEAFDKVAKMLGLGYPGGPAIDRMAKRGRADKAPFPRAWLKGTWNFSFSGLKTAVLYKLRTKKILDRAGKSGHLRGVSALGGRRVGDQNHRRRQTIKSPSYCGGGAVWRPIPNCAQNSRARRSAKS